MSTSKLAEVMQSELSVDCSHFSNSRARRGNRGCLRKPTDKEWRLCVGLEVQTECLPLTHLLLSLRVLVYGNRLGRHH
ncbi:hypothetical protein EYF80_041399 [Liparis tanakae]|uniref:Uncharacterized protein n=1 Tax=Liparis tanakae TaxID=230148 RepID=A0A4Z2G6A5_9TELE|nr:hypothetical protein EYF80_041399 [Liparis tanakae]